ncbi:MAG: hypothetical protein ACYC3P_07880 [Bellilinea sp.]
MNNAALEKIETVISNNLIAIANTESFKAKLTSQQLQDGDAVLFNNSFILRKPLIRTTKNQQFIMLKIKNNNIDFSNIYVCIPSDFDDDFKVIKSKQTSSIRYSPIRQAIEAEINSLGQLVFFLIGEVIETPTTVGIPNSLVQELKYDPIAERHELITINNKKILVVNQLTDPEAAWNLFKPDLEKTPNVDINALENAFGQSFEKLKLEARLLLNLPKVSTPRINNSFITRLRTSINEQKKLYKQSLDKCVIGDVEYNLNLRELMRISYNFADDAIKLFQLLVSIADLKAIILWSTLKSHYDVAESIRNLPWTKSDKKASPSAYVEKVKGARNRAFHNLLMFDRTVEADLSGIQVNAKKLTLFPLYGKRKTNVTLDYEDREIVEILNELTRADETDVTLDFWEKNYSVIEAFEKLLESTENSLWELINARA